MNRRRAILIATAAAIVALALYPPFVLMDHGNPFPIGYGWLFAPPEDGYGVSINVSILLLEWTGALIVGGLFWLAVGRSAPESSHSTSSTPATSKIDEGGMDSGRFLGSGRDFGSSMHRETVLQSERGWVLTGVLYVACVLTGIVGLWQVVGLTGLFLQLTQPVSSSSEFWVVFFIKLVVGAISLSAFFFLRRVIRRMSARGRGKARIDNPFQ